MTTLAQTIVDRVEIILQDTTNVRWSEAELLGWLNDGQREIVLHKADAYTKNEAKLLTVGTKQTIPSDGVMLLDVLYNMGTTGTTLGAAIRVVSREMLDATMPSWHQDTASVTVKHYVFDPREPKVFYVWPKSSGTNYVQLSYAALPADVAAIGDPITLDDIYRTPLVDYILYRAYMKDAQFAANKDRAIGHYGAFTSALGAKGSNQLLHNPNLTHGPFNQAVPVAAK